MNLRGYIMDVNKKRQPIQWRFIMKLVNIIAMAIECILFLVVICFA